VPLSHRTGSQLSSMSRGYSDHKPPRGRKLLERYPFRQPAPAHPAPRGYFPDRLAPWRAPVARPLASAAHLHRAFALVSMEKLRQAIALFLLSPHIPMLFMGKRPPPKSHQWGRQISQILLSTDALGRRVRLINVRVDRTGSQLAHDAMAPLADLRRMRTKSASGLSLDLE
jgi:hypothetical protein